MPISTRAGKSAGCARQHRAYIEAGAEVLLTHTFGGSQARLAKDGLGDQTRDILVTLSFDLRGRSMMGVKLAAAVKARWLLGVAVVGANFGRPLSETLTAVTEMRQAMAEAVLIARPNAGLPHLDGGESVFEVTAEVSTRMSVRPSMARSKL